MRRLTMAMAAPATLMLGAAPLAAHAQDKSAAISKDQRDKGMKDTPALAKTAGLTCDISDAYYLGTSTSKTGKAEIYEVACRQGLGYALISESGGVKAYDCLATSAQPGLKCKLAANANPIAAFQPVVTQSGAPCTVTDARYLGSSDTQSVYEAACREGPGFLIQTAAPGKTGATEAIPCAAVQAQNTHCTLTTKAQMDGYISSLAAKSGKPCDVTNNRYIGSDKTSGVTYYELACSQGVGFIVATDKVGGYKSTITCSQAQGLGGCTLTDSTKLAAEETGNYTRMIKAAGFNCDVSKYRSIGLDPNKNEVVELACSNRPDGTVAVFPAVANGQTRLYDCVISGQFGATGACTFSSPEPVYAKYSAALAAKGKSSCKVSGAKYLGRSGSNTDFVETACTDGKPGWVMELNSGNAVVSLLSCGQAKAQGVACTLPTNQRR